MAKYDCEILYTTDEPLHPKVLHALLQQFEGMSFTTVTGSPRELVVRTHDSLNRELTSRAPELSKVQAAIDDLSSRVDELPELPEE